MSPPLPHTPPDGLRVFDASGCLTREVMCFTDQLNPDQRAAIERHARSCSVCAQEQAALARASERFRRARPHSMLPVELRVLARQVALRSLQARRQRVGDTARLPARTRARPPWYLSRLFWTSVLAGMTAAALITLVALLVR
jgi:anti-sigma factor RsiW